MLSRLIEACVAQRFFTALIACCLAGFGAWTLPRQALDALPDTAETQVIVIARWDQFPERVEAYLTRPLTSALQSAAAVRTVRAFSEQGRATLYVVFENGIGSDLARQRVTEVLSRTTPDLPSGARVETGPDATGAGWIFQYALVDDRHSLSLTDLRALQDGDLRYALQSVAGVAEVATVGGSGKQYQVTVEPSLLAQHNIALPEVVRAVRDASRDAGGGTLSVSGREVLVRSRGAVTQLSDLATAQVDAEHLGKFGMRFSTAPLALGEIARFETVPEPRRGVSDLDGRGEVVGGIVILRQGANVRGVVHAVKERLSALQPSLPPGVRIVTTYDRSRLIERSLQSLYGEIAFAVLVVSIVIFIALGDVRSALVAMVLMPVALLITAGLFYALRLPVDAMSLSGVVLSIGVLVDGAIVITENVSRRRSEPDASAGVELRAVCEVAPAVFFALLLIAATFLPVFALTGEEGRLFRPLALAKTAVMLVSALLTVTLVPALLLRTAPAPAGTRRSRGIAIPTHTYERVLRWTLANPRTTVAVVLILGLATVPVLLRLESEFMPPLNEGAVLYMPVTLPGISSMQASRLLTTQDAILAASPEVERVFGKAGQAETATDPAPLSMIETTILLRPRDQWRHRDRFYSGWSPEWLNNLLWRRFAEDRLSYEQVIADLDRQLSLPGVVNSWTMPIRGRTAMLNTGARTPVAVKVFAPDSAASRKTALEIEHLLRDVPGTRSVFAERESETAYLTIDLKRSKIADYGLSVNQVQESFTDAIAGVEATEILEGPLRIPVLVRYPIEFRDSADSIGGLEIQTATQLRVPLHELASIQPDRGPAMLRTENGRFASYVYIETDGRDLGAYLADARRTLAAHLAPAPGTFLEWTGDYENILRSRAQLRIVIPATLLLAAVLLFLNTRSWAKTFLVLLAVPFSAIGAIWFLFALGYKISVATWVGLAALVGLDAETAVFMVLFLDLSFAEARSRGWLNQPHGLENAVVHGAAHRMRPKLMTVLAAFAGLLPALLSSGTGADFTKRLVAPLAGGLVSSFALELLVIPTLYLALQKSSQINGSSRTF